MSRARIVGLLCLGALGAVPVVAAECPTSCLFGTSCGTAVAVDSTAYVACDAFSPARGHAAYDLAQGSVLAEAYGCTTWTGPGGTQADAAAADRFRLVGPTGGGPIAFRAELAMFGGAGGTATASGSLWDEEGHFDYASDRGLGPIDHSPTIALVHAAGEEFVLHYAAGASAGGPSSGGFAEGRLAFRDLPPGYGVISCQGFAAGAVATRAASWGALKRIYR